MPSINDVMNGEGIPKEVVEDVSRETFQSESKGLSFLKVPCKDKPISDYLNNPLNKDSDEDFAQGLRMVDAFIGNTNLAILDGMGFIRYFIKKAKKKAVVEDGQSET